MLLSLLLLVVTIISLTVQGLNLGIDFEGGTSWDVPASSFTVADADDVLGQAEIDTEGSRIRCAILRAVLCQGAGAID